MEGEHRVFPQTTDESKTNAREAGLLSWLVPTISQLHLRLENLVFPKEAEGRRSFLDSAMLDIEAGLYNSQIQSWWQTIGKPATFGHRREVAFEDFGLLIKFSLGDIQEANSSTDPVQAIRKKMIEKLSAERSRRTAKTR